MKSTRIGDLVHKDVLYRPMLSEKYAEDFLTGLEMAKNSGATHLWGEGPITAECSENFLGNASDGVFMWPHVFADVTEDMECFHEELFGPVVTVVKAKDFDHALHLANASPYGLSSAIYTNDRLEAYRYKTGIKAGMTGINNSTTGAEAHLPFGGVKGSATALENPVFGSSNPTLLARRERRTFGQTPTRPNGRGRNRNGRSRSQLV